MCSVLCKIDTYLMTAARGGPRAQVPSINLCGQNRNLPAPARGGLPCAGRVNFEGSARTESSARATRMSRACHAHCLRRRLLLVIHAKAKVIHAWS